MWQNVPYLNEHLRSVRSLRHRIIFRTQKLEVYSFLLHDGMNGAGVLDE